MCTYTCYYYIYIYIYIHIYIYTKGLQGQKGIGTLVSSQERRAAVVPVINRGSPGDFNVELVNGDLEDVVLQRGVQWKQGVVVYILS